MRKVVGGWERLGVVSWEGGKGVRVVCWKGGKGGIGGRLVGWQGWRGWRAVTWQVGKGGGGGGGGSEEVARWERCKDSEVAKWQGGRFLVLFKSGGHRVSHRLHLFVSDVDQQQNKGAG